MILLDSPYVNYFQTIRKLNGILQDYQIAEGERKKKGFALIHYHKGEATKWKGVQLWPPQINLITRFHKLKK